LLLEHGFHDDVKRDITKKKKEKGRHRQKVSWWLIVDTYRNIHTRAVGFTLRNEKKCLPGFQLEKLKSS